MGPAAAVARVGSRDVLRPGVICLAGRELQRISAETVS